MGNCHPERTNVERQPLECVSKYQRPSVVMNINETCLPFKQRSVRSSIPGMFERNKLYKGCGICYSL